MTVPSETAPENTPQPDAEAYLRLLAQHGRSLEIYVHGLLPSASDAEDVLQECKMVMWRKFADFEDGSHFLGWARKIALNLILNFQRKEKRRKTSPVDQEFIQAVAQEIEERSEQFEQRSEFLRECLKELPKAHANSIVWRYFEGCEVDEIARRTERSEGATYRLLSRIRKVLNDCINRKLASSSG